MSSTFFGCPLCNENAANPEVLVALLTDTERWLGNHPVVYENAIPLNDYHQVVQCLMEAGQFIGTMLAVMDKPVVAHSLTRLAWERVGAAWGIANVGAIEWCKEHKVAERRKQYIEGFIERFPELEEHFKEELQIYAQIGVGKDVRQPKAHWREKTYEPYARGSRYVHFMPRPWEEIIGPVHPAITDYLVGTGHFSVCTILAIAKILWERDYGQPK